MKCLTKNVQGLGENTDMDLFILEICQINIINYQSKLHGCEKETDFAENVHRPGENFKVEIFLEQREVAFLSSSKICENLNFSTEHL